MSGNIGEINKLERQIIGAISKIKKGIATPQETNIGKLLARLKMLDEAMYEEFIKEYKVVFAEWKKGQSK